MKWNKVEKMISPKFLVYHDLIGFKVHAKNKSKKENEMFLDIGVVIDDTQNLLIQFRPHESLFFPAAFRKIESTR